MAILDPKRYDLAIKQLEKALNGNTSKLNNQIQIVNVVQSDIKDQAVLMAKEISAIYGEFEIVRGNIADFNTVITNKIDAVDGRIGTLTGDLADYKTIIAGQLSAASAEIGKVSGELADYKVIMAGDFSAVNGKIENLTSDVGNIKTLVFGSATGIEISVDFANAVAALIGNGYIKDAMIDNLSFDKITGVDINTTKLTVHSGDGKSQWKDNTILISDASRPRVQIGKDAAGDYNLYVWDAAGALMFDALGLTEKGIQREIIQDDMVAQDAAINAAKLDIDSLFRVVNEDESHTLKSTKVYFDSEKQTLDILFNSMTTNLAGVQDDVQTALTNISVVNGELATLVQDMSTINGELSATKTQAQQTADKFTWLVKAGSNSTDFTLTDRVATLLSQEFKIDALTTFKNSAESGSQTVIDGGAIKAWTLTVGAFDPDDELLHVVNDANMTIFGDGEESQGLVNELDRTNEAIGELEANLYGGEIENDDGTITTVEGVVDRIEVLKNEVAANTYNLEEVNRKSTETEIALSAEAARVRNLESQAAALIALSDNINRFMRFDPASGLIIGASGSSFQTIINEQSMNFMDGTAVAAYISNKAFNIENGTVKKLRVGNYIFASEDDGTFNIEYSPVI